MSVQNRRNSVCRYFSASGECFYGDDCQFLHSRPDSQTQQSQQQTQQPQPPRPLSATPGGPLVTGSGAGIPRDLGFGSRPTTMVNPALGSRGVAGQPSMDRAFIPSSFYPSPSHTIGNGHPPPHPSMIEPLDLYPPRRGMSRGGSGQGPGPGGGGAYTSDHPSVNSQVYNSPGHLPGHQSPSYGQGHTPVPVMPPMNRPHAPLSGLHSTAAFTPLSTPPPPMNLSAATYFTEEGIKSELMRRRAHALEPPEYNQDLPSLVEQYHELRPLEPSSHSGQMSTTFGLHSSVYRATHRETGVQYCLRRIHNFQPNTTNAKSLMNVIDAWKKIQHSNIVQLRQVNFETHDPSIMQLFRDADSLVFF